MNLMVAHSARRSRGARGTRVEHVRPAIAGPVRVLPRSGRRAAHPGVRTSWRVPRGVAVMMTATRALIVTDRAHGVPRSARSNARWSSGTLPTPAGAAHASPWSGAHLFLEDDAGDGVGVVARVLSRSAARMPGASVASRKPKLGANSQRRACALRPFRRARPVPRGPGGRAHGAVRLDLGGISEAARALLDAPRRVPVSRPVAQSRILTHSARAFVHALGGTRAERRPVGQVRMLRREPIDEPDCASNDRVEDWLHIRR